MQTRRTTRSWAGLAMSGAAIVAVSTTAFAGGKNTSAIVLDSQGSFAYGGTVITGDDGDTFHGDHGYVQYQIPKNDRKYPIVMWHGGGQFSRTWETTPDGRDGYQNILLRNRYSTYILDQPRRGRAGRTTVGTTIPDAVPNEASSFNTFRLGIWTPPQPMSFFTGVQFPRDAESLAQYWRQVTPNTGPEGFDTETRVFQSDAASALFDRIGQAILMTHSNSGQYGWRTAMKNTNVKAIIAYEPGTFAFPESAPPPDIATSNGQVAFITAPDLVSDSEFNQLAKIPVQVVYGDNIEFDNPSPIFGVELWRVNVQRARQFVDEINRRGGNAELVFLPDVGLRGNTHFPFSDLNNDKIADLLFKYLRRQHLDRDGRGHHHHHGHGAGHHGHDRHAHRR
jgi:hypothetical protein